MLSPRPYALLVLLPTGCAISISAGNTPKSFLSRQRGAEDLASSLLHSTEPTTRARLGVDLSCHRRHLVYLAARTPMHAPTKLTTGRARRSATMIRHSVASSPPPHPRHLACTDFAVCSTRGDSDEDDDQHANARTIP
ncbi:hypothetical protein C8R45DRAFT_1090356 [Mycena sanguinolenta]|nr:hypothetical protein C8R45DRAFT_1090356 [Mycena sanguinolenta]